MIYKMKLKTEACILLFRTGALYKSDFLFALRCIASDRQAHRIANEMIRKEMIAVSECEGVAYVSLNRTGRNYAVDETKDDYWQKHSNDEEKQFRTSDQEKLAVKLNDAMLAVMMNCAGVLSYKDEKPDLYSLYCHLSNSPAPEMSSDSPYASVSSYEEALEVINKGVYYSIAEYRDFVNKMYQNDSAADIVYGSAARGIYISDNTCLIIYRSKHGENKLVRIRPTGEQRLVRSLNAILKYTHVERRMPQFDSYRADPVSGAPVAANHAHGRPYALIMSDGDSLVYSTATGFKNGKARKKEKSKTAAELSNQNRKDGTGLAVDWLTPDAQVYQRIFITPITMSGLSSLSYLLKTKAEEWYAASQFVFRNNPQFRPLNYTPLYPYQRRNDDDTSSPAIYMPVFEAVEMNRISKLGYTVAIATYPEMVDAISHSICCEAYFYQYDSENSKLVPVSLSDYYIYDEYGNAAGEELVAEALKESGMKAGRTAYAELPARCGYESRAEFYNDIFLGNFELQSAVGRIEAEAKEETEKKRIIHRSVSVSLSNAFYTELKKAAKLYNYTLSQYIRALIRNQVHADATKYDEYLKQNKEAWKKR